MRSRFLFTVLLSACSCLASAQTVYESKDKSGPVFSDQPSANAQPIDLPPLNVIDAPPLAQPETQPQAVVAASYRQLQILSPENEGTIHTNTGAFDLQLQLQPELQIKGGDSIVIKLDGKQLAQRYTTSAIRIKAADWANAATSDSVEHSLQAAVIDQNGTVLIESAPIRFFAHRATQHK